MKGHEITTHTVGRTRTGDGSLDETHQAKCSCGWRSPVWRVKRIAEQDGKEHTDRWNLVYNEGHEVDL